MSEQAIPVKNRDFWIHPGIQVVRSDGTGPIMEVESIERRKQNIKRGRITETRSIIEGVKCSYVNDEGKLVSEIFHTRDIKRHE